MDILTDKKVKVRKAHICHGCAKSYEKGEVMRYTTSVDAGEINSAYWCQTCDKLIDSTYDYFELQDGIEFGSVREGDIEAWESFHSSIEREKHLIQLEAATE